MDDRRRRSPARLLAPLAIIASAVAVAFVVAGSSAPPEEGGREPDRQAQEADLGTTADSEDGRRSRSRSGRLPEGCYVVRAGDTLAGIAQRTGVQVDQLQDLNPDLDPQALVSGQRINVREGGCG